MIDLSSKSMLVVGFARTGQAVVEAVMDNAKSICAIDDRPSDAAIAKAKQLGVDLLVAPDERQLQEVVEASDIVVLSPGVAPSHPLFSYCDRSKVISEIELAFELMSSPIVAITGTNGKTTVTTLVASMLEHSGLRVRAVGNIGEPLIGIVREDLDMAVAEVSSFQLMYTNRFRPKVATWLNLAPDHLDWHSSHDDYAKAKARIWAAQGNDDVAIANRDDPIVWSAAQRVAGRVVSFSLTNGDYRLSDDRLIGPGDEVLATTGDLRRAFPHDVANALGALATARSAGASIDGCRKALRDAPVLAHRVEHVTSIGGVDFVNDSKATTPSAVIAALESFSSVVLIAGGRNKGLDLGDIARHVRQSGRPLVRGVIAIGESAEEVADAFAAQASVTIARSMDEAVNQASEQARPGDAVLLSPGCASFDWYGSYEERGNDFVACVRILESTHVGAN